jgi:hypothetical protein
MKYGLILQLGDKSVNVFAVFLVRHEIFQLIN